MQIGEMEAQEPKSGNPRVEKEQVRLRAGGPEGREGPGENTRTTSDAVAETVRAGRRRGRETENWGGQ